MQTAPILVFESDSSEEDEDLMDLSIDKISSQTEIPRKSVSKNSEESFEYIEFQNAITMNEWDTKSWIGMVNEVEKGRGGTLTVVSACTEAIKKFPRSSLFWKKLTDVLIEKDDVLSYEDSFKKCLQKCRSIELWLSFLAVTKKKTIDKYPPHSEQYSNAKKQYEAAFEKSLQSVGMLPDSHLIWQKYIDFVKEWPETGAMDSGKKLTTLRDIYQRAICNPMEDLDRYWKEYEDLEMRVGDHLAAKILPEFKPRFQQAKSVFKERKRLISKIATERIAVPPNEGNLQEIQQLDAWNKWIK